MIKIHSRFHSHSPLSWKVVQRLGLLRQEQVDPLVPEELAAALQGKQADVLMGYTGSLVRLAQVLAEDKERAIHPRFLVGGSETMTPYIREQIQSGFGVPVRDTYICQEVGMVAWECPISGQYHVVDDSVIVEVLNNGRPCLAGEEGEVVVTGLIGRAMPFIRYRLGDRAVLSDKDCPCGRRGAGFDRILGKMQDLFWLPDGREFNPWNISNLWTSRARWIQRYEIVQETADYIVMRIIPSEQPPPDEVNALRAETQKLLGTEVSFRIELVSDIKPDASGKIRIHRCLVRSLYNNPLDREWLKSV
jgi:phenylacetate-CoA ligase